MHWQASSLLETSRALHKEQCLSQSQMPLLSLPVELISSILSFSLDDNPHPSSVLLVNSNFKNIGLSLLHSSLRFRTTAQLELFIENSGLLSCSPRSLSVTLAGGTSDFRLFHLLIAVFNLCIGAQMAYNGKDNNHGDGRLSLKLLNFCLNSHTSDPNLHLIRSALILVK